MKILAIPNNTFSSFPEELGDLESLEELNASSAFSGGRIPENIGNLRNLKLMLLCNNKLSGEIPARNRRNDDAGKARFAS